MTSIFLSKRLMWKVRQALSNMLGSRKRTAQELVFTLPGYLSLHSGFSLRREQNLECKKEGVLAASERLLFRTSNGLSDFVYRSTADITAIFNLEFEMSVRSHNTTQNNDCLPHFRHDLTFDVFYRFMTLSASQNAPSDGDHDDVEGTIAVFARLVAFSAKTVSWFRSNGFREVVGSCQKRYCDKFAT